jgi:hypothetical protein
MFDALALPTPTPSGYDVAAGYVKSPGVATGWGTTAWFRASGAARYLLPIVGYEPGNTAVHDIVNELGLLHAVLPKFPAGAAIALDVEANVAAGAGPYVTDWCAVITRAGYFPLVYTSAAMRGHLPGVPLWLAQWTNTPHLLAGTYATQYASPASDPALTVDQSLVSDSLPLYDTTPGATMHKFVAIVDAPGAGYWVVADDGAVYSFGGANFHGGANGKPLAAPITGACASGDGYFLLGGDGGVFAFGDAKFAGNAIGK